MSPPSASLIISTYNWPQALDVVLKSVAGQLVQPDEVIIADDGSGAATRTVIEQWQTRMPTPLHHVWQEDKGFRAGEIRNKALVKSNADYIIQIDGDCVLHPHFIKDHLDLTDPSRFVNGSRVLVGQHRTRQLLESGAVRLPWYATGITNRINAMHMALLSPLLSGAKDDVRQVVYKVRGCNTAYWRADALAINGYDHDIYGWGREDSDFAMRLMHLGRHCYYLKMRAVQYHLHHVQRERAAMDEKDAIIADRLTNGTSWVENGISSLSSNSEVR